MTRRFTGTDLVIATHNRGKLNEFAAMFSDLPLRLTSAVDHNLPSPDETGTTFVENAKIKALFVAQSTGLPALADDSGLCIDLLGGAPGVYSADWAGENRDFALACERVHEAMLECLPKQKEWVDVKRGAHFVSLLMLAWPDGHVEYVEGIADGEIIWPPRGAGGHGYDPIFQPIGHTRTYGEMLPAEKNAISHRAQAFRLMREKCFDGA